MEFQVKKFLKRIRMTQYELAEKMGCNQSLVAMWATGRSFATYEKLCQLVELGMTAEELFGKELAERLYRNGDVASVDKYGSSEFKKGVALAIAELKAEGLL